MSQEETQFLINEELTAYLDGELSGEELSSVEQRLQHDPEYLSQMQQLQLSWDLLDVLPPTRSDDAFVKTTMELVVQDCDRDLKKRSWLGRGLLMKVALLFLLPGAVFASGYAVTSQQITAPYRQLISELPLIENHDRYSKLNLDIEFLKQLNEASLFTREVVLSFPSDSSGLMPDLGEKREAVLSTETIKDREARLAEMQPQQIESLKRNQEKFDQLTEDRKEAMGEFHQQLMAEKNKNQLARTMVAYYDWLTSLGESERIEVLDEVDSRARIKMIAKKIERQNLKKFGKAGATMLPAPDAEPFFKWYEGFLKRHRTTILKSADKLYVDVYRKESGGKKPSANRLRRFQRTSLSQKVGFMFQWESEQMTDLIDESEVNNLRKGLSLEATEILDSFESQEEQQSLIMSWIDAANEAKLSIDPVRLREFYNTLPKAVHDRLDGLSPGEWKSDLKKLYRKKRLSTK